MTVLLDDCSPDVRFALADALAESEAAPRHVILALAADQEEIAIAVLSRSPLFIDSELVDIVAAASEALQTAIAARPAVSSAVAAAIAEVGDRLACWRLIENPAADVARISLRRIAERFGDEPEMRERLLALPNLPPDVRQMLIQRLSDALGSFVAVKSWVPEGRARQVTRDACERATVAIAAEIAGGRAAGARRASPHHRPAHHGAPPPGGLRRQYRALRGGARGAGARAATSVSGAWCGPGG